VKRNRAIGPSPMTMQPAWRGEEKSGNWAEPDDRVRRALPGNRFLVAVCGDSIRPIAQHAALR
jgi:hypothetical protein